MVLELDIRRNVGEAPSRREREGRGIAPEESDGVNGPVEVMLVVRKRPVVKANGMVLPFMPPFGYEVAPLIIKLKNQVLLISLSSAVASTVLVAMF